LPVRAVVVDEGLAGAFTAATWDAELVALQRVVRPPFEVPARHRTISPLWVVN
jgi:hypothetical protein